MQDLATRPINGLDLDALNESVDAIRQDSSRAQLQFRVKTRWAGQTRSETTTELLRAGGEEIPRNFTIASDEPTELLGTNTAPNPQELLMSAVNACMMVGYVAQASVRGITLSSCTIETEGELDLRGFFGLDETVPPGYRRLDYSVRLEGDGTPEQYREIHEAVKATSPNYFNMARPIEMNGTLV